VTSGNAEKTYTVTVTRSAALTNAAVTLSNNTPGATGVTATIKGKDGKSQQITVEKVILAVGIVGNVEDIGLEGTGVKVDRTHVVVDGFGRTGEPGVYAIGDLATLYLELGKDREGLPVLRALGFRTPGEIERERYALKALRGDFDDLPQGHGADRASGAFAAAH